MLGGPRFTRAARVAPEWATGSARVHGVRFMKIRHGILLIAVVAINLRAALAVRSGYPRPHYVAMIVSEGRGLIQTLEDGTTYVHSGTPLAPGPARLLHGPRPSLLRIWSPALAAAAFTLVFALVWLRGPIRIGQARPGSRP